MQQQRAEKELHHEYRYASPRLFTTGYRWADLRPHRHCCEKGTALIFTCNHCPFVRAWDDRLVALGSEFMGQGVGFGAISSTIRPIPHRRLRAHAGAGTGLGMPYPYLYDEAQDVARAYGAERTPEIFCSTPPASCNTHGTIDDNYEDESAVQSTYFRDALAAVVAVTMCR